MQRTRDYYGRDRLHHAVSLGALCRCAVPALKKPLAQSRVTISPPPAPYDPAKGDQGPGAAYKGRQVLQVYDGDTSQPARFAHLAYRLRSQAHVGDRQRHLVSLSPAPQSRGRPGGSAKFAPAASSARRPIAATGSPSMSMPLCILARASPDKVDCRGDRAELPCCHQTSALVARTSKPTAFRP